jgi:outer membrane biosynthesis protein TonB
LDKIKKLTKDQYFILIVALIFAISAGGIFAKKHSQKPHTPDEWLTGEIEEPEEPKIHEGGLKVVGDLTDPDSEDKPANLEEDASKQEPEEPTKSPDKEPETPEKPDEKSPPEEEKPKPESKPDPKPDPKPNNKEEDTKQPPKQEEPKPSPEPENEPEPEPEPEPETEPGIVTKPKTTKLTAADVKRLKSYPTFKGSGLYIPFSEYKREHAEILLTDLKPQNLSAFKGASVKWFKSLDLVYCTALGQHTARGIIQLTYSGSNSFNLKPGQMYERDVEIRCAYVDKFDGRGTVFEVQQIVYLSDFQAVE